MMLSFTKLRALTLNDQAVSQSPTPSDFNLFSPQESIRQSKEVRGESKEVSD